MERLFAPFERLDPEHGPADGVGIGLVLAKVLIEAMGGTIAATRFRVRAALLPLVCLPLSMSFWRRSKGQGTLSLQRSEEA